MILLFTTTFLGDFVSDSPYLITVSEIHEDNQFFLVSPTKLVKYVICYIQKYINFLMNE